MDHGFLRAILVKFAKGTDKVSDNTQSNVYATFELQFKSDSDVTDAILRINLPTEINSMNAGNPFSTDVEVSTHNIFAGAQIFYFNL